MFGFELVKEPVVERPVILELQRAQGMGDAFDGIRNPVRPIVHGVNVPFIAGAVMAGVENPVHGRVAQVHIGAGHVNTRPKGLAAVGELVCITRPTGSTKRRQAGRLRDVGELLAQFGAIMERQDPREIDEARRLLYVGMTRAEDRLVLTRADQRDGSPSG